MADMITEALDFSKKYCNKFELGKMLWDHVMLVRKFAVTLAEIEHADRHVVELAAILHDNGKYRDNKTHHKISVEIAREFLKDKDIPEEKKKLIYKCIKKHRTKYADEDDNEVEVKIIQSADALGVLFDDPWQEKCRAELHHEDLRRRYERKFQKINLESARKIARPQVEKLKKQLDNA